LTRRPFGVTAVAEGVKTEAHAWLLAELGCHPLQAYGIAQPMPAHELHAWLDTWADPALS
jgi:EAL domain-containing protein (putative c-di-GMP-specific phosphodiesterase class I)